MKVVDVPVDPNARQDRLLKILPMSIYKGAGAGNMQIAVLDLTTREQKVLVSAGSNPQYAPTGHIVYGVDGTLQAVPFDLGRLEITGAPVPVLEGVMTAEEGLVEFSLSADGSLVYVPGGPQGGTARTLVWVDRQGREEPVAAPPRAYTYPRLSPDGTRVALDVRDQEGDDILIWDVARENLRPLTFDPSPDSYPTWTPDGLRVVFTSRREGPPDLFWRAADGTGAVERLTDSPNEESAHAFSSDGTRLGVRPSNRRDNHIPSCCASAMSVAALGDGRLGVSSGSEPQEPFDLWLTHRGDTA